jgi:hypothetical protein
MRATERDRIDRLPTRGERWVGGALSALLALAFIPGAIFVLVFTFQRSGERSTGATIAAILGLIGVSGALLFYRICFTEARAASARAQRIYRWISIVVATALAILLIGRQFADGPAAAPSNTSLERTRER